MTTAKPQPRTSPPKNLRFADLVDAYINEASYREAARELADYHGLRLRVLAAAFHCDFQAIESDPAANAPSTPYPDEAHDRYQVARIARDCLTEYTTVSNPFGVPLVGIPGTLEQGLRTRHDFEVAAAIAGLQKQLRETFADCLKLLYPGIERRTVSVGVLADRGVPAVGPDPNDFW